MRTILVVFYAGSELLVTLKIDFVSFFTSVLAVMFGALGASQVSADFNSRQRGLIAAARIFSTFEGPTDGSEEDVGEIVPIKGDIKFESCEFSYPARPDFPIFYGDGVSLSVSQKESIGLVGRSGSGKSTILQIVMRFYENTGGSASLDGREFSELNVNNLRNQVGYGKFRRISSNLVHISQVSKFSSLLPFGTSQLASFLHFSTAPLKITFCLESLMPAMLKSLVHARLRKHMILSWTYQMDTRQK